MTNAVFMYLDLPISQLILALLRSKPGKLVNTGFASSQNH